MSSLYSSGPHFVDAYEVPRNDHAPILNLPSVGLETDIQSIPTDIPSSSRGPTGQMPWIDRTSLDIPFDRSCFDSLDDQLLHHPIQSFADICWADAVQDTTSEPPTLHPPELMVDAYLTDFDPVPESSIPSFDSNKPILPLADKLNTPGKHLVAERLHVKVDTSLRPAATNPRYDAAMLLHPHFSVPDPSESIGFFPTRPQRTSKRPSRFFTYFHFHTRPLSRL
ncbi:hypothetical protein B0H11DRAFT_506020 [Mycena galericulata]|nr:hypothetical protein B0H11DRAFT_506020 [Mycena galericulata]